MSNAFFSSSEIERRRQFNRLWPIAPKHGSGGAPRMKNSVVERSRIGESFNIDEIGRAQESRLEAFFGGS